MKQLAKLIRQRLQATAKDGGSHPDPNLLAAFVDKALAKTERVQVLEHLARCVDCRDVVSLATPEFETAGAVPAAPSSGWLRGPILRWGTLAASVAVVTVAVTLPRMSRHLSSLTPAPSLQTDSKGKTPEARRDEPADKLAASGSPSHRAPEVGSSGKQPKGVEFSNRMNAGRVAEPSRSSKAAEGYSTPPVPQATVPAPPPFLAGSADADHAALKKEQGSHMQVATSNEVVAVEAKAAPAAVEIPPGKAKDAPLQAQDVQAGLVRNGAQALADRSMADASSTKNDELRSRAKSVPRWTLSSDGTLQRSFDAGKTWATIPVAGNSVFRALAAVGANIWVGGSGGSLYRSADAGEHWLRVKPATGGKMLTADIIGVEFTDANHGKLTTADEQVWITADAGQTWQTN
jgi:Photosynthesis system II assembly factor YCF48/Putative zinc-finger